LALTLDDGKAEERITGRVQRASLSERIVADQRHLPALRARDGAILKASRVAVEVQMLVLAAVTEHPG
jgi:hypothetical protein